MSTEPGHIENADARVSYCIGDFTLDAGTRRLLRGDAEIHISPKAFDLLILLVDNRARAVSKTELQQRIWPSSYVSETNLASLIAELRRALDDVADDPRFIRTVHRFGYWFIAAASPLTGEPTPPRPAARYWLVWETRQMPLFEGDNILGRGPDAGVWIDAGGVSRHHARILVRGSDALLEDLGSKNGTFVAGQRVTAAQPLADGDRIRLGTIVITFRIPQSAHSTETSGV